MKLIYFGTPEPAAGLLKALLDANDIEVVAVVTQPDKPVGRDHVVTPPPVKVAALNAGVKVFQFASLRKPEVVAELKKLNADVFVVAMYGKLIPADVLHLTGLGCVNVHPSLLPKYRGPDPIRAPILHGDTETGVSIMVLDEGMDTGPVLAQTAVPVRADDTAVVLTDRLMAVAATLLVETLRGYVLGVIKPVAQDASNVSLTKLLEREDGFISLDEDPVSVDRKIRALSPWPGCYTIIKHAGKDLRVKLLPEGLVQPEGKKPMTREAFERGYGRIF